jgi:hypothetical protein
VLQERRSKTRIFVKDISRWKEYGKTTWRSVLPNKTLHQYDSGKVVN